MESKFPSKKSPESNFSIFTDISCDIIIGSMKQTIYFSLFLCIFFFASSNFVDAQLEPLNQIASRGLAITLTPEFPKAFDEVRILIDSSTINLDSSTITWKADGRTILRGSGEKSTSILVGDYGKTTSVQVVIDTGSDIIVRDIPITPNYIDLIWQANTYTPSFYKGKALFTSESSIKIVAVPHIIQNGKLLNDQELYFQWIQNNGIVLSGIGKNVFSYDHFFIKKSDTIAVQISLPNGNVLAKNQLVMNTDRPKIMLYEEDPLLGTLSQKAILDKNILERKETVIKVFPFFFSINTPSDRKLEYQWFINNTELTDGTREKIIFRIEDDSKKGSSVANLRVTDTKKQVQSENRTLSFTFGQ